MSPSIFFLQQIKTDYSFKYEHSVLGLQFCELAF